MNVGDLRERLDAYGDHLNVIIEDKSGVQWDIYDIDDETKPEEIVVVIYTDVNPRR